MEPDASNSLPYRNWLELPNEVTATILQKVGVADILNNVQLVCTTWRSLFKDPSMWRYLDLQLPRGSDSGFDVEKMARHAVDRSCGQLVDVNIAYFATTKFILYLARRSRQLRRLRIASCRDMSEEVLEGAASKFPMLEELELKSIPLTMTAIEAFGEHCPKLATFKCNFCGFIPRNSWYDGLAEVIVTTMPQLCHLQLLGDRITNSGLKSILNGCPHLETLDLRGCHLIDLKVENVGEVCSARYKKVRFPAEHIEADEYGGAKRRSPSDSSFDNYSLAEGSDGSFDSDGDSYFYNDMSDEDDDLDEDDSFDDDHDDE
uniref:F-box domain-containing protein n=1 Tax=Kalanchoe fedtschenkoi TaxID=63787 RepID=A0A7N0SW50_KALFE